MITSDEEKSSTRVLRDDEDSVIAMHVSVWYREDVLVLVPIPTVVCSSQNVKRIWGKRLWKLHSHMRHYYLCGRIEESAGVGAMQLLWWLMVDDDCPSSMWGVHLQKHFNAQWSLNALSWLLIMRTCTWYQCGPLWRWSGDQMIIRGTQICSKHNILCIVALHRCKWFVAMDGCLTDHGF